MRVLLFPVLLTLFAPIGSARELLWAGAAGVVATAGEGAWDENTSAHWRDESPQGPLVRWTQHRVAVFRGSGGGTVRLAGSLQTDGLRFDRQAGSFVLEASGDLAISGSGLTCAAPRDQTIRVGPALVRFLENASAAEGAQAERVRFDSEGLLVFAGTSTAGRAQFENRGEMQFTETSSAGRCTIVNSGQVSFTGRATLDRATITNDGILAIDGRVSSGPAVLTNRGPASLAGPGTRLEELAISNLENAVLDCTGESQPEGLRLAALTNAAQATLHLGRSPLEVRHLHLVAGNALIFHLGSGTPGSLRVTASLLGSLALGGTAITILEEAGATAPRTITLLDWSAASYVAGIDETQFFLQELPAGRRGKLRIVDRRLELELTSAPTSPP